MDADGIRLFKVKCYVLLHNDTFFGFSATVTLSIFRPAAQTATVADTSDADARKKAKRISSLPVCANEHQVAVTNPPIPMRTLAVDLGSRRVGLAMSDEGGRFATPLQVLEITSINQAADPILKLCKEEDVRQLLVGLPINMDGSFGPAAQQTLAWGRRLSEQTGIPVLFADERLSSFAADQQISQRRRGGEHITRKQKKSRLDAHAAAGFLQAFLDGKLQPISTAD